MVSQRKALTFEAQCLKLRIVSIQLVFFDFGDFARLIDGGSQFSKLVFFRKIRCHSSLQYILYPESEYSRWRDGRVDERKEERKEFLQSLWCF